MKQSTQCKKISILMLFFVTAALALSGCSGSDGATGATGPAGPAGPVGPVTLTEESCLVCHNTSDVANVASMHNYTFNTTTGSRTTPRLNESNLTVSNIIVSATAAGLPKITFNVKNGTANYTTLATGDVRFYIADQVPAGTVTSKGTYGSPYWETWGYATPTTTGAVWDVSGAAAGNYSITFPTAFGVAASASYNAADYNAAHVQRLFIRLSSTVPGVGGAAGILDFNVPPAGATAAALLSLQNQYVTVEACMKCHGPQMNGTAHGSSYRDTLGCVICHSPLAASSASEVYLPKFIHEIHAAIDVPEFPTRILGAGYKDVTYPRPIAECVACHTASGKNLGTGNKIDNWKNNPTAEICGSCHEGFPAGHAGGTSPQCTTCHPATGSGFGKSVTEAHAVTPAAKDVPEYVATMTITAPANGTHYVTGEAPTVTVTLKDKATDTAVPGTLYTAAKHAAGTFSAGSLSKAVLYVYGPRANAKPVLTKGAATLSATGVPTQSNSLLLPSTDAQVLTDSTGFKYKLTAIPTGMASGTYMIRFVAQNYGRVSDTNYKLDSTVLKSIQIGTATVEQRIAGNAASDTCTDCHGTGLLAIHNARHSVSFSASTTDECISCHDKSGNHAQALDLRVHSIHSASKSADLVAGEAPALDWSKITYPQGIPTVAGRDATTGLLAVGASTGAPRCITCHTGTAGTGILYRTTSVSERSCSGCHADKRGAVDHFKQNGGN